MVMKNLRKYGKGPFEITVLHGGPGAPGYMAPVARELSEVFGGVLEPLQTADSLDGQIEELREILASYVEKSAILVGSSWGAVLALFTAARNKDLTKKLILVGSAVFDAQNSSRIESIRLQRLDEKTRARLENLKKEMNQARPEKLKRLAKEWGDIFFKTDVYDPLTNDMEVMEVQYDIFEKVWPEFVILRDRPGYLESEFSKIEAPTVVIHGDYDPHPLDGIRPFLRKCLGNVNFHILAECGHYPWIERRAREPFFKILRKEISSA
jgi:pimeloyl-ACP methyl ester carboxylesterase